MEAKVTEALHDPCDRPAPTGDDSVSHTHDDDGRICAWDESTNTWLTVRAVPKDEIKVMAADTPMPGYPPTPDQKAVGMYTKFSVRRIDGRDQPGGDREDARQGYFVLDPVFDPAARPALALYATLVREMGYEKLADDIDYNLGVLAEHVLDALRQQNPDTEPGVRVVATWTRPAGSEEDLTQSLVSTLSGLADPDPKVRTLPNG